MHLYIIDGYSFIFRAYHSLPPLTSPDGAQVSALYGFTNMIMKLCKTHKSDMIAVALDGGGKNHRHQIFPDYKANRISPPEDLITQFPLILEALDALNITALQIENEEADDIIASYAIAATKKGYKVTIVSSDKDLMTLLANDNIDMYDPIKNKIITTEYVVEKFGVVPKLLLDAMALIGDKSDNIPGVAGIGPKTASELINNYNSLEKVYENIEKISSIRIKKLLYDNNENAFLSKKLLELKTEMPADISFDNMKVKEIDKIKLINFAQKFGFKSLLSQYKIDNNYINTQTHSEVKSLEEINNSKLDQELISRIIYDSVVSLYYTKDQFFLATKSINLVISYQKDKEQTLQFDLEKLTLDNILSFLKPILESESVKKILFLSKEFIKILSLLNIKIVAFEDLALMSYVISTSNRYKSLENLIPDINLGATLMLNSYNYLQKQLIKNKDLSLYELLEKPLIKVLANIENKGVLVEPNILKTITQDLEKLIIQIENEVYEITGEQFNIGSPKQLGIILFDKLQLVTNNKKSKKSGNYTTDADTLEELSSNGHKIAELILKWRQYTKLINTYTEGLLKSINPITKRIHTTFEMNATTTGRLSSHNPNMQNIPIKTEEGRRIRKAFIAKSGNCLISADYSQIELRLLAHFAKIQQLKEALISGLDIHAVTASEIFNIPLEKITPDLRRKAKGINFGIIYGISPFGLARNIHISQKEAKLYIEKYFNKYPGIKDYMETTVDFAKKHGYVQTIMKRRCAIEEINSNSYAVKSFAERAAINAPLQGSSADIIKKAMIDLTSDLSSMLILQIHDELLFEVPEERAQDYAAQITQIMENAIELTVPLKVDIKIGNHW